MIALIVRTAAGATPYSFEGDPTPATLIDTVDLFDLPAIDSGYWPSSTDPIAIRFFFTPEIVIDSVFQTGSQLAWSPLSQRVEGSAESTLIADVEIGSEVKLDLFGIFSGIVPIASRSVHLETSVSSDGLWLEGDAEPVALLSIDDPDLVPPIEYGVEVVPTIEVVVGVGITPQIDATLAGVEIASEVDGQTIRQGNAGSWVSLPSVAERPGELGLLTRWSGFLDAIFSLQLTPQVGVDTPLGAFTLAEFPIDITLAEIAEPRETAPAFVVHALPVIEDLVPSYDYGQVDAGETANWPVPIENIGALLLEGTATVDGDPAFSVWPAAFAASPGVQSGLTVTFAPTAPGTYSATLILATNDPTRPEIAVAISGTSAEAPGESDLPPIDTGTGDKSTIQACGCTSASPRSGWIAALLLAAALRRAR